MALSITNAQHKNALYYAEWHWDECYGLFIVMLRLYVECHYAECRFAECHFFE
jgi:hypothetical protein